MAFSGEAGESGEARRIIELSFVEIVWWFRQDELISLSALVTARILVQGNPLHRRLPLPPCDRERSANRAVGSCMATMG